MLLSDKIRSLADIRHGHFELIRAVNYFIGNFDQPIKSKILAALDVDSLTVNGYMRIGH